MIQHQIHRADHRQPTDTSTSSQPMSNIFRRSSLSILLVFIYFGDVVIAESSTSRTTEFKLPPPPPPPPRPGMTAITPGENVIRGIPPPPPPKQPSDSKTTTSNLSTTSQQTPPLRRALSESFRENVDLPHLSEDITMSRTASSPHIEGSNLEGIAAAIKSNDVSTTQEIGKDSVLDCTIELNVAEGCSSDSNARQDFIGDAIRDAKLSSEKYEAVAASPPRHTEEMENVQAGQKESKKHMGWEQMSKTNRGEVPLVISSISSHQDPVLRQSLSPGSLPDSRPPVVQTQLRQVRVELHQSIRPTGQGQPHERQNKDSTWTAGQGNQLYGHPRPNDHGRVDHLPPRRSQPSSSVGSVWKSVWGKVERGLDGLAGLEDSIAGRAQQILSTTTSTRGRPAANTVEATRWSLQTQHSAKLLSPTTKRLAPYGNKFEVAKKKQEEKNQAAFAAGKVMRANGGASSPDGQHPVPPVRQYAPGAIQSPMNYPPPPKTGSGDSVQSVTQSSQYISNPYLQSSNLKSPPKQAVSVSDPHSRASRIPWDATPRSKGPQPAPDDRRRASKSRPEYEIDEPGFFERILRFFSSIPNPADLLRIGRKSYDYAVEDAWGADDDDEVNGFFGLFRRKKPSGATLSQLAPRPVVKAGDSLALPLKSMMERCDNGKSSSLLSTLDETRCRTLGRYQACFDSICILCVLVGIQQTDGFNLITLPLSVEEFATKTLPLAGSYLRGSLATWAPIFAGYAYLALYIRRAVLNSHEENLATSIGLAVQEESEYAQLYLRLTAAIGIDPNLPSSLKDAAASQVHSLVSTARLNAVVMLLLGALTLMTVTIIRPMFTALGHSVSDLFFLEEIRSWPIAWQPLWSSVRIIFHSLVSKLESLMTHGLNTFLDNPVQFSFQVSIFVSAVLIALIPNIERTRTIERKEDDEVIPPSSGDTAQQFAKLGSSSATRLTMLSENGSIESALERWRNSRYVTMEDNSKGAITLLFRSFGYKILVAMVATLPVLVSYLVGMSSRKGMAHVGLQWDSLMDVSIVLIGVFMVASNAIDDVVASTLPRPSVLLFVSTLASTIEEIKETNRRQADIQFMASISPTAGLVVRDLWAAHTTKRAWAVRGASFQCRNGEILVVLGDDGAGKTRLLTTVAEALLFPPRRSLTSAKVRGFVGVGGVENSKWDKSMLRRRLGVLLSDVRTVADAANLYSGCSLEEILEPVDGLRVSDGERKLGASERASILLALKITGLFNTLIPKLPSKLSSVLTANEEELRPSSLGPRSHFLSPGEWSKLILSKVLAQTIHDNDNAAASTDKVENCLVGSVLLLDEPTSLSSEVDEAKILKDLRQTGAATVLATNKWATGRFADHIVVVRDGAIVESGSHNELISRGPQQSLYAAKWHAMTMQ